MTLFAFQVLSLMIPQYIQNHSHNIENIWMIITEHKFKYGNFLKIQGPGFPTQASFHWMVLKALSWSSLQWFFFFFSLPPEKSHVVLDPSKKKKSVPLNSKYQAQQRKTEQGRKVLDIPILDFQDADCEVIRELLGIWLQAHFAVCYKLFVHNTDAHSGGQFNCYGTWSKCSILKI